jgi:hypothetical protein
MLSNDERQIYTELASAALKEIESYPAKDESGPLAAQLLMVDAVERFDRGSAKTSKRVECLGWIMTALVIVQVILAIITIGQVCK